MRSRPLPVLLLASLTIPGLATAQGMPMTVGDPAPALAITHWVKGKEVSKFAPDKIYVVEFWATWCGPCIANMEHLSVLQDQNREVTFVGISNEPLAKVVEFLFRRDGDQKLMNDRTRYTLATDPDGSVWADYLDAAAIMGIPATFLIGRDGHIEWLGHPKDLEKPLEQVIAGTWNRQDHREGALRKARANSAERKLASAFKTAKEKGDWPRALAALEGMIERDGKSSTRAPTKLRLLLNEIGDRQRGVAFAVELTEQGWEDDDWTLMQVAWAMTEAPTKTRDLDLALRAAVRSNELSKWTDEGHVSMLARVHYARGEHEQAVTRERQALGIAEKARPKVKPERMKDFEEYLGKFAVRARNYERARDGR